MNVKNKTGNIPLLLDLCLWGRIGKLNGLLLILCGGGWNVNHKKTMKTKIHSLYFLLMFICSPLLQHDVVRRRRRRGIVPLNIYTFSEIVSHI